MTAIIDGAFLAALHVEADAPSFDPFRPVSAAYRPDETLVIADGESGALCAFSLEAGQARQLTVVPAAFREAGPVRCDAIGNIYAADAFARTVNVVDARFRAVGEIFPPYDALGLVQGRVSGISFGPLGEFYITDAINGRVFRYNPAGHFLASFTGGEEFGWGELLQPEGIACSPDGAEVYVCDAGKRQVVVFDPSGTPLRVFGGTELREPWAVAVNRRRQAFVADRAGHSICVFDQGGSLIDRIEPAGGWNGPSDIVLRDSSLTVADPAAGRVVILKLRPASTE